MTPQIPQEQQPMRFSLADLTGQDVDAIMSGLNELQTKVGRPTMNKLEAQLIEQVMKAQADKQNKAEPPEPPKAPIVDRLLAD